MARVEVDREWVVQEPGNGLDAALDRAVQEHGMTAARAGERIEMTGGSQVKMRLLGGYFTKDSVLPRKGFVERAEGGDGERITLHLEDTMGFGLMDSRMHEKYERILESVAFSVEGAIKENAGSVSAG